jgi:hypothetical protein
VSDESMTRMEMASTPNRVQGARVCAWWPDLQCSRRRSGWELGRDVVAPARRHKDSEHHWAA